MNNLKKVTFTVIVNLLLVHSYGQSPVSVNGNTFDQRSNNLINDLKAQTLTSVSHLNFSIIAAKLLDAQDTQALSQFNTLLQMNQSTVNEYFTSYYAMHTYLVCKKNIPSSSVTLLKNFYALQDYSLINYGTNNLFLVNHAAAYLGAEQWNDFQDVTGRSRDEILAFSRGQILNFLTNNFQNACYENGARSYHVLNLLPIKMLIDFSKDKEVRQMAYRYYQQMLFNLVGNYNNGIYIDTAPRNRYYQTMGDGYVKPKEINTLCWLMFGNDHNNTIYFDNWNTASRNVIFLAFPGYSKPDPRLLSLYQSKTYPYVRTKRRATAFNSLNYGLASNDRNGLSADPGSTLDEMPNYLAWQSDNAECHFSVWQHNLVKNGSLNDFGRGRNPYSRFFQHNRTLISTWNVPTTYPHSTVEVPFHQQTYKAKIISNDWVFCHTGSMMFAFTTLSSQQLVPYAPNSSDRRAGYDILKIIDRKGWWILETTEVLPAYQGGDFVSQLNAFKDVILSVNRVSISNFTTDQFTVDYLNTSGETLSATYYNINQVYTNQHKLNNQVVVYDANFLYQDPYINQLLNSLEMNINFSSTNTAKIKLLEPFTNQLVLAKNAANKYYFTSQMNTSPYRFWVIEDRFGNTKTVRDSINLVLNDSLQYIKNVKLFTENQIVDKEIYNYSEPNVSSQTQEYNTVFAENGEIRFNSTNATFEGFSNSKWYPLGRHSSVLNQSNAVALMAYSLRKINDNYTGPLVKIRRTDGVMMDIYADNLGNLDAIMLQNFIGSSDGFVQTWYDQSGNGRHCIQNTSTQQPKLVSNGVIFTFDGSSKPCMKPEIGKVLTVQNLAQQSLTFGTFIACYADITKTDWTSPFRTDPLLFQGQAYTEKSHLVGPRFSGNAYRYGNHYTNNNLWNTGAYTGLYAGRPLKCAITFLNPTVVQTMTPVTINMLNDNRSCCNTRAVSAVWEIIIFSNILDSKTRNLIYTNQSNYYFEQ